MGFGMDVALDTLLSRAMEGIIEEVHALLPYARTYSPTDIGSHTTRCIQIRCTINRDRAFRCLDARSLADLNAVMDRQDQELTLVRIRMVQNPEAPVL